MVLNQGHFVPGDIWQYLETIFTVTDVGRVLLVSSSYRQGMLLNTLKCTRQPLGGKGLSGLMSSEPFLLQGYTVWLFFFLELQNCLFQITGRHLFLLTKGSQVSCYFYFQLPLKSMKWPRSSLADLLQLSTVWSLPLVESIAYSSGRTNPHTQA